MLEKLPFPKGLTRVPEYAGGHHEKMDGTGYPRGLRREQMSTPARMMAIADIFEALTAADRPYKKAKPLSVAMKIMGFMKKDNHLDPVLLDLFVRDGLYLEYARRYMPEELIEQVPVIKRLLSAFHIAAFEMEGFEGEDVLATLARVLVKRNMADGLSRGFALGAPPETASRKVTNTSLKVGSRMMGMLTHLRDRMG